MISEVQQKLLEVLAPAALAIASIFFAVLSVLFGAILTLPKDSDRRPLKLGIYVTYAFSVISLILAVVSLLALQYKTVGYYQLTILGTGLTIGGIFIVGTFLLVKTIQKQ
jgi:hypothetical protein